MTDEDGETFNGTKVMGELEGEAGENVKAKSVNGKPSLICRRTIVLPRVSLEMLYSNLS